LVVTLAILGAVAAVGTLAFNRTSESRAKAARCLDNLRRLTIAWGQYSDANQEILLSSAPLLSTNPSTRRVWVSGTLNAAGAINRENWDAQATVRQSPLIPYLTEDARVWRCPSDLSQVLLEGRWAPRVRSYSMSSVFDTGYWLPAFRYRTYSKRPEIVRPVRTFVFVDEHPDSINDGAFAVQMVEPEAMVGNIIDLPATLHSGSSSFAFADGHVEKKRWTGKTIQQPVTYRGDAFLNIPARDSLPDVKWLSGNCTVRR